MIKFEYYDTTELTDEERDALWEQDVCMDDWDYMLFHEAEGDLDEFEWIEPEEFTTCLTPADFYIERLLNGSCYNRWYKVQNFKGRKGILGVAYHA